MKALKRIFAAFAAVATLALSAGCVDDQLKEVEVLNLRRCLTPSELGAKVLSTKGDVVTFSWNVGKDAEQYNLVIYTDEAMTQEYANELIEASAVPFTMTLKADQKYYYKVQALNSTKEASNWAIYKDDEGNAKAIKTFAVKDNLFLKVDSRDANSIGLAWSTDIADFKDVDRIEYGVPGAAEADLRSYALTDAEKDAGKATIAGLEPSTEYAFILYFLTASRGSVDAWTTPDISGTTEVKSLDALTNALKTAGAKILLSMEGSPYEIGSADISNGVTILGAGEANGTKPVLKGEFHITDTFDGGDLYFEGIDFDGDNSTYGFAIQHKNGCAKDDVKVGNITYVNCDIHDYSKGIIYEWGKSLDITSFTYEGCHIFNVNKDGTVGGDGFDLRQATKIGKLTFTNNTIYQSFRTFLRIDPNPVIGDIVFENNLLMNLCFVDNTNNGGILAFQAAPQSFSFKKNLIINMVEKATLESANTKYKPVGDLGLAAGDNYFYNIVGTFFTDNATMAAVSGTMLDADPCYNAKGGIFNYDPDSDIAGKGIGPKEWWTPYSKEPEDLTLLPISGNHVWDLGNAKYFAGTSKEPMVRDQLMIVASESFPISLDGAINFATATTCTKKGLPTDGYLRFIASEPGSLVIKPIGGGAAHIVVGTTAVESPVSISVKGGASTLADMANAQKIVISDITEPTAVCIYATGAVGIAELAWSTDVSAVNTALPAPKPTATPSSFTAGEATDVVITWENVDNAASYSAVFNGKTYAAVQDEETGAWSYTVEGKTTGMLDAGSYTVDIYANPGKDDIYNTMSEAGTAAFAVLPKSGSDEGETEFIVKSIDELVAAIGAGKTEITLAEGEYVMEENSMTITAALALKGQAGAKVQGAFTLGGEVGSFKLSGIEFKDKGAGCFITLAEAPELVASEIVVDDCVLDGYTKSAIYGNFATSNVDKVVFSNCQTRNWGTGQGIFDFRKGTYGEISLFGNTIAGGRDLIRLDAACATGVVRIMNNTIDGVTLGNGNGILYVRAAVSQYVVANNLIINEVKEGAKTLLSKIGTMVPSMRNNFFYNVDETNFWTGTISKETATANNGCVLTGEVSPVKDAANYDYTLVNGLAISNKVGAPRWNPSYVDCDETSFVVKSSDEFLAALDAGKTEITLAAEGSPYTFELASFEVPKGMHLSGEVKDGQYPEFHGYFNMSGTEDLGDVIFENIKFAGDGAQGVVLTISGTPSARSITMRNCEVDGFTKSVYYGNGAATVQALVIRNVTVTNHGTGQGVFDIRKGAYTNVTIEHSTVTGGRDLVRADAGTITGAFNFVNNTICKSNIIGNGNAIMYVRATPTAYKFANNLFLNEVAEGKSVLLAKATGVTVPTYAKNNFFYNVDEANFWTGVITKELAAAVVLSYDPCKDSANGDFTLTDALCLSSNVGAARWNTNAGHVTTDFTASNTEELLTAIGAGKTAITLKYGTYDLTTITDNEAISSGIMTLTAPITLKGEKKAGKGPEVIGAFKLGAGANEFVAQGIIFNGNANALGNLLEVAAALESGRILVRDCEVMGYSKSLIYGNAEGIIGNATFSRLLVHDMGTGQGMFDLRKKVYGSLIIENSTIYNGGRDLVRCDAGVGESVTIRNNTLANTGIDAGNGLLWIRSAVGDKYVVENNLFVNETGEKTWLAKTGATKAIMKNNHFYNVGPAFWTGTYTMEEATANSGSVLEADPCAAAAEGNFKLVNAELVAAGVGDPRWR